MLDSCKKRDSGIELLRIIAIFLIVLAHIVQTLGKTYDYATFNFTLSFGSATTNPNLLFVSLFRHCGHIGTVVFFVISTFFLVDNDKWNNRKALRMWVEMIFISYIFLIIYLIIRKGDIAQDNLLEALFPLFSCSTWYLTFYLLVLLLAPLVNKLFKVINKYIILVIGIALMIVGMILHNSASQAFSFPGMYCLMYYFKHHNSKIFDSKAINIAITIAGFALFFAIFFVTNAVGLLYPSVSVNLLWQVNYGNIPYYLMAFGLLNLFRRIRFKNGFINFAASLSLLCYILHENTLFRYYTRPVIWEWIYNSFGFNQVALASLIYALGLSLASLIIAIVYSLLIRKHILRLADLASDGLFKLFSKPRNKMFNKKIQEN